MPFGTSFTTIVGIYYYVAMDPPDLGQSHVAQSALVWVRKGISSEQGNYEGAVVSRHFQRKFDETRIIDGLPWIS